MFGNNSLYVTVNGTQEISGSKTFVGAVDFTNALVTGISGTDLSNYMTLASASTQTITASKIFTGSIDFSNASLTLPSAYTPDMTNYMTLNTVQNVTASKYFTGNVTIGKNSSATLTSPKPTFDISNTTITWPTTLDFSNVTSFTNISNLNIPWSQVTSKPNIMQLDATNTVSSDMYFYKTSGNQTITFGKNSSSVLGVKPVIDFTNATIQGLSYSSLTGKPTIPSLEDTNSISGDTYFYKSGVGTRQKLYFGNNFNYGSSTYNLDMKLDNVLFQCTSNTEIDFSSAKEFTVPSTFGVSWNNITDKPNIGTGDVTTTGLTTQTISRPTSFTGTFTINDNAITTSKISNLSSTVVLLSNTSQTILGAKTISGTLTFASGSSLTLGTGSSISLGTIKIPWNNINSPNVALYDGSNTFSGAQTFTSTVNLTNARVSFPTTDVPWVTSASLSSYVTTNSVQTITSSKTFKGTNTTYTFGDSTSIAATTGAVHFYGDTNLYKNVSFAGIGTNSGTITNRDGTTMLGNFVSTNNNAQTFTGSSIGFHSSSNNTSIYFGRNAYNQKSGTYTTKVDMSNASVFFTTSQPASYGPGAWVMNKNTGLMNGFTAASGWMPIFGSITTAQMSDLNLQYIDDAWIVMPGFKLVLYSNLLSITVDRLDSSIPYFFFPNNINSVTRLSLYHKSDASNAIGQSFVNGGTLPWA